MALTTVLQNLFKEKGREINFLNAEKIIKQEANYYKELPVDSYFKAFNKIAVPFMAIEYHRFFEKGIYLVGFLYDNSDFEVSLESHQIDSGIPESNLPVMKLCIRASESGIENGQISETKYALPTSYWGMLTTYDNAVHIKAKNQFIKEYLEQVKKLF